MRRARRSIALLCLSALPLTSISTLPASAEGPASARVLAAADEVTVGKDRRGFVYVDPGVWVASVDGALELRASRADYDSPVTLTQTDAETGAVIRTLHADLLDGWFGLRDFLHVAVRDADGHLVMRQRYTFCPNSYGRSRLSDEGPLNARYPQFCGGNPFTLGNVYGIDYGWAVPAFGEYDYGNTLAFRADERRYRVAVWIDGAWAEALGVAPQDQRVEIDLRVVRGHDHHGGEPPIPVETAAAPFAAVPETTTPPADTLPDLIALPAWGMQTRRGGGRDLLAFNATEWNAGPGTMLVEGFRQANEPLMDAYQYFLRDGVAIGRAPAGGLEFHAEHGHWHFLQFTEYSLIDATTGDVQLSGKQSWCLVNTDAIDLTLLNAAWAGYGGDVSTQCGSRGAIWIREVLDVGWGDTYGQYIPGQAFDITNVPNGRYIVRVEVNPEELLVESSMANNVTDRVIRIRGSRGARTVIVKPWHGIEDDCVYC